MRKEMETTALLLLMKSIFQKKNISEPSNFGKEYIQGDKSNSF